MVQTDYNFRVYQDGSLNIGNGNFIATSTGAVTANDITINGGSIVLNGTSTENAININNGIFIVTKDGGVTASSMNITGGSITSTGININDKFIVNGTTGSVTAGDITITGSGNRTWIIDSQNFQVDKYGQIGAGSQLQNFDAEDYDFSVDNDGTIRFKGDIQAYDGTQWYEGVNSANIQIKTGDNIWQTVKVVEGLIVGIRYDA